jgi:hypothetical protein
MTLKLTAEIVQLQQQISSRIAETGFADTIATDKISRHLAEIAVLGRAFSEATLPLFLQLNEEHAESLAQLSISIKCDLEELGDSIRDVDHDLHSLMAYLNRNAEEPR